MLLHETWNGDEIVVAPGIYTSGQNGHVVDFDKNVVLRSSDGPQVTIIDGSNQRRCIARYHGHMFPVVEGFTLRNGASPHWDNYYPGYWHDGWGGAIYCISGAFTLRDCVVESNTAHRGGGVCLRFTPVNATTLINCRFIGNNAVFGGAV